MNFDNSQQFDVDKVQDCRIGYGIQKRFTAVVGPQTNAEAESTTKKFLNELKKSLNHAKGLWVDDLPVIIWSGQTIEKSSIKEISLMLVHGLEAVLFVDFAIHTH